MMETPRLGLPLLAAGQAQKEVAHNEALLAIDTRLHGAVLTRSLLEPPSTPQAGAMYLVPPDATGAWGGAADSLACWDGLAWRLTPPVVGSLVWIADEGAFTVYDGGWSQGGWPAPGLRVGGRDVLAAPPAAIAAPAGGSTIDTECRAALVALLAALKNQGIVL